MESTPIEATEVEAGAALPHQGTSMVARTCVGLGVAAVVVLIVVVDSTWPAAFLYAAVGMTVTVLALSDLAGMAEQAGVRVSHRLLVSAGAALFLLQWAGWAAPAAFPDPWLCGLLVLLATVVGVLVDRVLRGDVPGAIQSAGTTALALAYVPLLLGFLTATRLRWGGAGLFTVLAVCKFGSSGAYFFGKWLGRRRLAPVVSPGKTVAGALGQVGTGMAVAWMLAGSPLELMGPWTALAFGAVVSVAAIAGDLMESLLKRQAGVKDSSRGLPGAGGMLDMVDDVLLGAPVAYFVLLLCA